MIKILLEDIKLNKNKKILTKEKFLDSNQNKKIKDKTKEYNIFNQPISVDKYFKDNISNKKRIERTPQEKKKKPIFNKYFSILFFLMLIIIIIYFSQSIFEKVDVFIKSKQELISYNNKQFIAKKEVDGESINFMIMIYPEIKTKKIFLTENKEVSQKAVGYITLYNEYSLNPQKIVAQTFVSDEEGKTYLTEEVVTIPGYQIKDEKIIPGQADVMIKAFLPGSNYNGEMTHFFINAFKNDIKYNKIYGKLKTPLIGGMSGLAYSLNKKNKEDLNALINTSLKEELIAKVRASIPSGYILYPKAIKFSYDINENILSEISEIEIEIEELLSVVLIEEKSLIAGIIKNSLPLVSKYDTREIMISNLDELDFNFTDLNQEITKEINSISFKLSGDLRVIWQPNIDELKEKLKGIKKDEALPIFRQEIAIISALIKFFPPWKRYFPKDLSRINIILEDVVD